MDRHLETTLDSSMGTRLRIARRKAGFASARAAALRFNWGPSTYAAHENGQNNYDAATASMYGRAFNVSPAWLLTGEGLDTGVQSVPIIGLSGAGLDGSVYYSEGSGGFGEAPVPPGSTPKTVAVEVRGAAMRGIAEDGWLIYYDNRPTPISDDMIGELCVLGLLDGRVLIKTPYPNHSGESYDLESAKVPIIRNCQIEWAAPVTAIVPRRAARRLLRKLII